MSRLFISLLGPPGIFWEGEHLHIPRRQTRALLYRLAAHMQPVARDQLTYLFWSNHGDTVARRNLTHLLTHLRAALPEDEELLTDSDLVALNPALVGSDCFELEQNLAWRINSNTTELAGIAGYYRGPFLAGFSLRDNEEYDEWIALERCIWERSFLEVLKVLLDGYYSQGLFVEAISTAQRYLRINALDEEVHQRLIEMYAVTGNRAAALQQYQICTAVLGDELGMTPLDRTQRLYQAAIEGRLSP